MQRYHKADLENRMYVPIEDGKKIAMPRYFKDKMYNNEERTLIQAANTVRLARDLGTTPEEHREWLAKREAIKAAFRQQNKPDTKTIV